MVVGGGVLTPNDVKMFQTQQQNTFETKFGPPLMNTIIVLNAAKAPTDDVEVRRTIIHAIDKAAIVDKQMAGIEQVADSLFPKDAPYCNVDLTPRWDYDFEKAKLINCPVPLVKEVIKTEIVKQEVIKTVAADDEDNLPLILGLSLGIGVPCLLCAAGAFFLGKSKGYKALEAQMLDEKAAKESNDKAETVGAPAKNEV